MFKPISETRNWTGTQIQAANHFVREFGIGNISFGDADENGMETGVFMGAVVNFWREGDGWMEINEDDTADEAISAILRARNDVAAEQFSEIECGC